MELKVYSIFDYRSGSVEDPKLFEQSNILPSQVVQATHHHIAIVKDVVEQHYRSRQQTDQHLLNYIEEEWLHIESMLTQERGVWGPYRESYLTKWMLDMSEGPSRMRKKIVRNDAFYHHYPYQLKRPSQGQTDENLDNAAAAAQCKIFP